MSETPPGSAHPLLENPFRLPTFLREYDKLARQCAGEEVDYPRYLLRLAELEMMERERRTVERRIRRKQVSRRSKALDSFESHRDPLAG